jgi:CRISPR-associated protein Csc3
MPSDISFLEFASDSGQDQDGAEAYSEFLRSVANRKMRRYKQIVHDRGEKQGQTYYGHVMDLVSIADKLRPSIGLDKWEMRCVLLALTIHDINKIPPYDKRPDGRELKYADAATTENIREELERLEVDSFFPEWRDYLADIVLLAHYHQESATGTTDVFDQRKINHCRLPSSHLKGPLKFLMKAADTADNSHSGDHCDPHEMHIRDKLLQHINAAMPERQYRFMGHRLAELRGIFTNVMHNEMVKYFREKYGENICIDLLYYPEGVNYLLDKEVTLLWNNEALHEVATRIQKRLAAIQLEELRQFIKARPAGIVVDNAAISSGATVKQIFEIITDIVYQKQYKPEWRTQRNTFAHNDLKDALTNLKNSSELKESVSRLLSERTDLIASDEMMLKRGEFVSAYRKFLEDHRANLLKSLKADAWTRVYRLFNLPEANYQLYGLIDPYRRGYFLAYDLPVLDLDKMQDAALADLIELEREASEAVSTGKANRAGTNETLGMADSLVVSIDTAYLIDYLKRNLEVWDSLPDQLTLAKPVTTTNFGDNLRQYANAKRPHEQCCDCGTSLKASEWMAAQVPANIGVQSFSNRLEGGSLRDPKRNICDACRIQFILEKLAWRSHRDKQGAEQSTFYLHLFPYAFFTQPELHAWWLSIENLRDSDHTAFLIDTKTYFRKLETSQGEVDIQGYRTSVNGLGLPTLSETLSNTPILPIIAPGDNYGLQFLLALEKAVVLSHWFECRTILSRSPVPPLNLSHEYIDGKPVVLMVEGMPRNMSWLLPTTSLDPEGAKALGLKLSHLHRIAEKLYYKGGDFDAIPHDFATAAADDPLALYYETDRLIEKKIAHEKGRVAASPEQYAIYLSRQMAPILQALVEQT